MASLSSSQLLLPSSPSYVPDLTHELIAKSFLDLVNRVNPVNRVKSMHMHFILVCVCVLSELLSYPDQLLHRLVRKDKCQVPQLQVM